MELLDRIAILSAATLMLFVMFIERHKRGGGHLPAQAQPPAPGLRLLRNTNVPECRPREVVVNDVAWLTATEVVDDSRRQ